MKYERHVSKGNSIVYKRNYPKKWRNGERIMGKGFLRT